MKLFKSPLQLVVVEGSLARESGVGAGPPDGAEAGAGTLAGASGVRRAGTTGVIHGRGERSGGKRAQRAALKLHDPEEDERFKQDESTEASRTDRNVSVQRDQRSERSSSFSPGGQTSPMINQDLRRQSQII